MCLELLDGLLHTKGSVRQADPGHRPRRLAGRRPRRDYRSQTTPRVGSASSTTPKSSRSPRWALDRTTAAAGGPPLPGRLTLPGFGNGRCQQVPGRRWRSDGGLALGVEDARVGSGETEPLSSVTSGGLVTLREKVRLSADPAAPNRRIPPPAQSPFEIFEWRKRGTHPVSDHTDVRTARSVHDRPRGEAARCAAGRRSQPEPDS